MGWRATSRPLAATARRRPARVLALAGAFSLLTVLMTWPLALHAGSSVKDLGDPLYDIWTMRWVQHQLTTDPAHLWDANILYPFTRTLVFSEPQLSTAILAWPIQLLTRNDVLTYNLMFLATFVVLGTGMALLVEEFSGDMAAGLLAGILAAYTPYRYGHLSHLNLLGYGWLPLGLWALVRYARRRRRLDAALASLFLTIQVLASDTLAALAFGALALLLPFLLWPPRRRGAPPPLGGLAVALGVPLLALLPVLAVRFAADDLFGFARDLGTVREMSATVASYRSVSPFNHFWRGALPQAYPSPLFPGLLTTLGALLGLVLAARRWPRWALYATLLALAGFVLSLGPETAIGPRLVALPYRWLHRHVPGVSEMRDATRFGTVALLGFEILAGLGFAAGWRHLRARLPGRAARPAGAILLALSTVLALAESYSDVATVAVPRDPDTLAVYDWLAAQPRGAVIEFPANGLWTDPTQTARQMYYSTRHWQVLVNGYTSFYPDPYLDFLARFHGGDAAPAGRGKRYSEVSRGNIGLLQDIGVRYVVIHRAEGYDWGHAVAEAERLPDLTRLGERGDAVVYELAPGDRTPVELALAAPATAVAGGEIAAALIARNDNPSSAASALERPSVAVATWMGRDGKVVSRTRVRVHPQVVDPGVTGRPIRLAAPSTPGLYRLQLTYGSLAAPCETTVEVRPAGAGGGDGPPIVLRRITGPDHDYRPGERVELRFTWEVRGSIGADYAVTAQLLASDGHLVSQWDGAPFAGPYQTSGWAPGTTLIQPVAVPIPDEAPPGHYRLLVALYDAHDGRLPRATIELPDGSRASEGLFGPLVVLAP